MKPVWSKSQSDLPSYPTRYRLKCQMIENNVASVGRVNIGSNGRTCGTDEDDCDGVSKPADFVASADNFVRRKFSFGFPKRCVTLSDVKVINNFRWSLEGYFSFGFFLVCQTPTYKTRPSK